MKFNRIHKPAVKKIPSRGVLILILIGCGIFFGACEEFIFLDPLVFQALTPLPGATFVGNEACVDCHEDEYNNFEHSDHWSVAIDISTEQAESGIVESCESCHGAGSLHVQDSLRSSIVRGTQETCFTCHLDVKGQFSLQHHHPVREGQMECVDCHNMHGNNVVAIGGQLLADQDDRCLKCHMEQRGPFIFEHDAMREGCQSCHNVHGSTSDKLLVAGQTTTCIRCHWEVSFAQGPDGALGNVKHGGFSIGQGEECIDHHRAPHGSNIWRTFNR